MSRKPRHAVVPCNDPAIAKAGKRVMLAATWRERHDAALAAMEAATTEAERAEAERAYDAIMSEAEAGTGRVTIN